MMCNWTLEVGLSCSSGNRGILNQCELHFHEIIHLYGIKHVVFGHKTLTHSLKSKAQQETPLCNRIPFIF